jgi:exopolysaccharide production protein ExoF
MRETLLKSIALLAAVSAFAIDSFGRSEQEARVAPAGEGTEVRRADAFGSATAMAGASLSVGDRAKITFFEMIDVPSAEGEQPQPALRTFYQRMDLTAEYTVQPDGTVSFPRLGQFLLAGRALQDVQADIAAAFERVMGRSCDVNVAIVERQPIYVVGPVKSPGAYKHAPGMIVLQAVALAGGLDRGLSQRSQVIESLRESERMRQTAVKMNRLLAQRARLEAERQDPSGLDASARLVSMTDDKNTGIFFASENAMLQLQRKGRQHQLSQLNANVTTARTELKALQRRAALFDKQLEMRYERLRTLHDLLARGLETRPRVIVAESEVADIEGRQQELYVAISRAEQKLAQTEEAIARLDLDHRLTVEKESAAAELEIAETESVLASTELVANVLKTAAGNTTFDAPTGTPVFEIVRRKGPDSVVLAAQETTLLQPGDVLRVGMKAARSPSPPMTGQQAAYTK